MRAALPGAGEHPRHVDQRGHTPIPTAWTRRGRSRLPGTGIGSVDLDDPRGFRAVDAHDALGDVEATARQWREARARARPVLDLEGVEAVIFAGMGGSGIAGDLVGALAAD